jgi:hypothetical protein
MNAYLSLPPSLLYPPYCTLVVVYCRLDEISECSGILDAILDLRGLKYLKLGYVIV